MPPEGKARRPSSNPGDPPSYLEQRAAEAGLTMTRGRVWTPNSHLALQAGEFAEEHGDALRFHRRMFKSYFEDLEDIGKVDVIVRAGDEAGLDPVALREALETRAYAQQVDDGIEWARGMGVTGVPTFIFQEQWAVTGAQDYNVFQSVMSRLGKEPRTNGSSED